MPSRFLDPDHARRLAEHRYDFGRRSLGGRVVLVVIFDAKSSLGLVRLRVKKAGEEHAKVFDVLAKKQAAPGAASPFAEITDDDIDNLFSE